MSNSKSTKVTSNPTLNVKNWYTDTICLGADGNPTPVEHIKVRNTRKSVRMPGAKTHAGIPIDACLAVSYIKQFLNNYKLAYTPPPPSFIDEALELHKAGDADKLREHLANHQQFVEKQQQFHKQLLKMTYGLTMEKDIAMRILSQPGCEGFRFYLCAKQVGPDKSPIVSLVIVGVDQHGKDLNYDLEKSVTPNVSGLADDGVTIDTDSSTGEYYTPPYDGDGGNGIDIFELCATPDEKLHTKELRDLKHCFVLLNIALKHPKVAAKDYTKNHK